MSHLTMLKKVRKKFLDQHQKLVGSIVGQDSFPIQVSLKSVQ